MMPDREKGDRSPGAPGPERPEACCAQIGPVPFFDLRRIERESFVRQVEFHPLLASTNDRALQLAAEPGVPTPLLVLAEQQTAGRGRGSHRWWSQPGAVTFSLLLDAAALQPRPEHWPRVSLTAAVAVCEVLESLVPHLSCGIRWPNDVVLAGRKICGILPELPAPRGEIHQSPRLVLGVGINVNNSLKEAPSDVRAIGTSLIDLTGNCYGLTDFLLQVLERLSRRLDTLALGDPQLAAAWSRRCVLQGRTIELETGPTRARGICGGIDFEGALVLHTPRGPEHFYGGVVTAVE